MINCTISYYPVSLKKKNRPPVARICKRHLIDPGGSTHNVRRFEKDAQSFSYCTFKSSFKNLNGERLTGNEDSAAKRPPVTIEKVKLD